MAAPRRFLPFLWAGLIAQPACVVTQQGSPSEPTPRVLAKRSLPTVSASSSKTTEFASLITGPGERMAVHDPDAGVFHRTEAAGSTELVTASTGTDTPPTPEMPLQPPPPPPDHPLVAAVRANIEGHPELAIEYLNKLDKPNQDLTLSLIPVMVQAAQIDLNHAKPADLGQMGEQLQTVADSLTARASLRITKAHFCRAAKDYGKYDPYPDGHQFRAGDRPGLYVEVKNVRSEPIRAGAGEQGGYATRLTYTLQILDRTGAVVELTDKNGARVKTLTETTDDKSRSPIHDYFLLIWVPVPPKPGDYAVSVEVCDPAAGRAYSQILPLKVQ